MKLEKWKSHLREAMRYMRAFARRSGPLTLPATTPRLGLALGGGFARSLAHIGVLKVLEENQIRVHCLAGTSAGSIIAGAYASGATVEEIAAVARRARWKDFARWTLSRMGLASNHRMEAFLGRVFRAVRFEDLKIPLAVVATDLSEGRPVIFTTGELALAVRASCAYPGLFQPVAWDGRWLVDGGLVSTVPASAVKALGAHVVLAVSLDNIEPGVEPRSLVDVLGRSFSIAQRTAEPLWRQYSDIVVEPHVSQYRWDAFEHADELIAAGEKAMREALPDLQRLLRPAVTTQAAAL